MLSCDKDKENVAPTCQINSPKDGAEVDLHTDLVITASGEDTDGTIAGVVLKINGTAVESVTSVPVSYTLPAEQLSAGALTILLTVTDDKGATAESKVEVTVVDNSQNPTCEITEPADNATLNIYEPFTIKGNGEAVTGEISSVKLSLNGTAVTSVTSVPFEYTVEAEAYPAGELTILLEIENSRGHKSSDQISVTLADQNEAPTCQITSPANGAEIDKGSDITIKGEGSDPDGSIVKVKLTLNGEAIASVTSLPFEYSLTEAQKVVGELKIALEVEDNHGKTASDEITVNIVSAEGTFTDPRDGKVYKTIKIGTQVWFAENLAYLPSVNAAADSGTGEKPLCYYVYGYDGTDVAAAKATQQYKDAGVLYNYWATLNGATPLAHDDRNKIPSGVQGPCPDGWHIPSKGEWNVLFQFIYDRIPDSEGVNLAFTNGHVDWDPSVRLIKHVQKHLKKQNAGWLTTGGDSDYPDANAAPLDTYGFGLFPGGYRLQSGGYYYYSGDASTTRAFFWTPEWNTRYASPSGGTMVTSNKYEMEFAVGTNQSRANSARCLKD